MIRRALLTALLVIILGTELQADDQIGIHGFISQGYLRSDKYRFLADTDDEGTFEFNEMGLNFLVPVSPKLHLGIQFFARDLGKTDNDSITVDWAYADYRWRDWLGIRLGKVKTPYGLHNETRDIDASRLFIFCPFSVYEEEGRSLFIGLKGGGLYGLVPGGFSYQAVAGTVDNEVIQDFGERGEDARMDYTWAAQIKWEPYAMEGFLLMGSFYNIHGLRSNREIAMGPPGTPPSSMRFTFDTNRLGVLSASYERNRIELFGEYHFSTVKINIVNMDMPDQSRKVDTDSEGFYFGLSYQLFGQLTVGGYYSEYFPDRDDKKGDSYKNGRGGPSAQAWLKDYVVTARWDFNPNWILKVESHFMDGLSDVDWLDDPQPGAKWRLLAAKATFIF